MTLLSRAVAILLVLMALVVVFLWITSPTFLVDNSDGRYPMWERADWVMGVATIPILLVVTIIRKVMLCRQERAEGSSGVTREYLEVNLSVAAVIVLTMWYYWNWLMIILPTDEIGLIMIHLSYWGLIHPIYVLLSLGTAAFLWRCGGRK